MRTSIIPLVVLLAGCEPSCGPTLVLEPKEETQAFWKDTYGLHYGGFIPAKNMDTKAYVVFQTHSSHRPENNIGEKRKKAAACQLAAYRKLEALHTAGDISASFFEGYGEEEIHTPGRIRVEWETEKPYTDDEVRGFLYQAIDRQNIPGSAAFLLTATYDETMLFSGWEDEVEGSKEAGLEYFSTEEELKKRLIVLGTKLVQCKASIHDEEIQAEIQALQKIEQSQQKYFARRGVHAYENSLENAETWFVEQPSAINGYSYLIGSDHKYNISDHPSFMDYVKSLPQHPQIEMWQCGDEETVMESGAKSRESDVNVLVEQFVEIAVDKCQSEVQ